MGGGGSAGEVNYPDYMKTAHEGWLGDLGALVGGASPYAGQSAYNPDTPLSESDAAVTAFSAVLAGIVDTTSWAALFTQSKTSIGNTPVYVIADMAAVTVGAVADMAAIAEIDDPTITADVAAFASELDDNVEANILPRYRRGMQDINAVVSSAFPIGEAIIEAMQAKDVAKYDAEIRTKALFRNSEVELEVGKVNVQKNLGIAVKNAELALEVGKANLVKEVTESELNLKSDTEYQKMYVEATQQLLQLMLQRISWNEGLAKITIEANRIKIVAKKEEMDANIDIDAHDGIWALETYTYGANMLGAISGGTSMNQKPGRAASAIGGALSGAATGAMIGSLAGPGGAGIGAAIGGAAGLLGGLFG